MKKLNSPKEKILDRTLYLIGKNGNTNVSVRDIAKEAGVNIAAINYHFRTKELMFEEMENLFIDNYNQAYDALENSSLSPKERIEVMLNEIMEYTLHYPGITIIINEKIADDKSEMGRFISENIQSTSIKIRNLIKEITQNQDDDRARFLESIIISSVVYPASVNHSKPLSNQLELENETARKNYIKQIMSLLKG